MELELSTMPILCTMKFLYVLLPSPQSSPWRGEEFAKRQVRVASLVIFNNCPSGPDPAFLQCHIFMVASVFASNRTPYATIRS